MLRQCVITRWGLQVRKILVRVRVENEPVQLGGRTEHGHSGKPTRGPTEQIAVVGLLAVVAGVRRVRTPPPEQHDAGRPGSVAGFVGGASSATAALRQRAGRRRSVPSPGRGHHRQQTPRRGARPTTAVVVVVFVAAGQSETAGTASATGRRILVAVQRSHPTAAVSGRLGHGRPSGDRRRPHQQTKR